MSAPDDFDELVDELTETRPLTDAGNAERLRDRNKDVLRYVHKLERWLIWDSTRWAEDATREAYRRAIDTARSILAEASIIGDDDKRKATVKHAVQSEKRDRLEAMLALARALPPLAVTPDDLDRDPDLLAVPNGVLDLKTGALLEHDPARLMTKLAPVPYDPEAKCPTWDAFLEQVITDPLVRAYLQRAVGYSLTGNVTEHCLFFCYGSGANGKSTLLETILALVGEYGKAAQHNLLLAAKQDRHAAEIADLQGVRFVTSTEAGEGRAWDESKVKVLTGGDTVAARRMYGHPFNFTPTHKFWVAANHKPGVTGTDTGFWRRVHLIPFTVTIPKENQDPELREKLRAELPGILAWAVRGCLEWWRIGMLGPPLAVLDATEEYRAGEDTIGAFLGECCTLDPPGTPPERRRSVTVDVIHERHRAWAAKNEEEGMSKRALGNALTERPGLHRGKTHGHRAILGLGLKVPWP